MPMDTYQEARKLAQREFRSCTARGIHPYLPRLDDFLPPERQIGGQDLGLIQIPMEFIVGAKASGRTQAFARNFMPLLPETSEFADKWTRLCNAHLQEGIRDPVKAWEYMNRYYIEEGNKRVSVLKYFGAASVAGNVTRLLPARNGSAEVERYYAFVDFYKYSKVNFLEFSRPDGYRRLQQFLGKAPGETWTDEDRRALSASYHFFRQAYEANGGGKLPITPGDAMLAYIQVYGYPSLRGQDEASLKKSVASVWEEITLQKEEQSIDVKLDPTEEKEEKGPSLLKKVLPRKKVLKAAFLYDKTPEQSGWTNAHEQGRQYVAEVLRGEVETSAWFNAMDSEDGTSEAAAGAEDSPDERALVNIRRAIREGNTVIFTTSPRLFPASLRAAVEHPDVTILNCSLNKPHRYVRSYYARIYEVKFIAGAVAGALAGERDVGYLCDYPIFGQVAGINAFALGVQFTNPRTRVYLEWSAVGGFDAALSRLRERGIRLISGQDQEKAEKQARIGLGLSLVSEAGAVRLATPVWNWGAYYEALLRRLMDRSLQLEYAESGRAVNYYWGLSAGVVDLKFYDRLPDGTRKMANLLLDSIRSRTLYPFTGPLYDQSGQKRAKRYERLTAEQIMNMDWLSEIVVGRIPAYDELDDVGRATVGIVGVGPSMAKPE